MGWTRAKVRCVMKSLVLSVLLLLLAVVASSTTAQNWQSPRMAWGDPDLQGVWTNATVTGLERLDGLDELVIGEQHARALEQQDAQNSDKIRSTIYPRVTYPRGKSSAAITARG